MGLMAKENGSPLEPVEAGVFTAVCYSVCDLGHHRNEKFGSESRKALITWELPSARAEFTRDGKTTNLPRAVSKRFTVSLSEKASLRAVLESWRGRKFTGEELRGFDLRKLIGSGCQLQIIHQVNQLGKSYASVASVMALPRGSAKPQPENPPVYFSFDDAGPKPVLPDGIPPWVAKLIQESTEWKAAYATSPALPPAPAPAGNSANDEDVPF